jgi:type I restriction enzyme S subunit
VEWLGEVPGHWGVAPFYSVAAERDESNTGMLEDNLLSLSYGRIIRKDINSNDGLLPESFETYQIVRPGDIVFRLTDLQNDQRSLRTAIVEETGIITSAYVATRPMGVDPRYLGQLLRAYDVTKVFYSMGGGLRQSMKYSDLKRLPLLLPPRGEQSAIATFLDRETTKLDTLIAKQAKLLELLQEKRQALISHAVTKGLNPDVPMKDSGVGWLGEVPAHWDVVRLGILFREVSESGNDELPVLRVSIHDGVSDREFDEEELDRKVTRSEDRSKYKRVEPGDLVYNMMRAWQGGFGAVTVPGMVSPAYVVARPREPLRTDFIEQLLRTPQAVEKLRCHSYGVADFRLRLYWDEFKSIEIAIPPLSEQEQIMASISGESGRIDTLTEKSRRSIELMREHRTALISAAVTGKIDVREAS